MVVEDKAASRLVDEELEDRQQEVSPVRGDPGILGHLEGHTGVE